MTSHDWDESAPTPGERAAPTPGPVTCHACDSTNVKTETILVSRAHVDRWGQMSEPDEWGTRGTCKDCGHTFDAEDCP